MMFMTNGNVVGMFGFQIFGTMALFSFLAGWTLGMVIFGILVVLSLWAIFYNV